jgi:transposase
MSSLTSPAGAIHPGMDTSKNTIVVAALLPGEEVPVIDRLWNGEGSVRHLVGRFADRAALRACDEAGPCGFELHRLLSWMGVACDVVAPSLIPRRAGDRVKTDRRDAGRLARLHRAGEQAAIRVPTEAEEAVRDLVRARAALLADRKRAQQRLTAMLLRHGRVWRSGSSWTQAHEQWIAAQRFSEPALGAALAHYRAALDTRQAERDAVEAELAPWAGREPLAAAVARLGCYRGIAELTGLVLAAEVAGWRRFPSARAFMCVTGLVPAEYSSGERTRRGPGHQGRVRAGPHRADRGGLVLPVPARDRRHVAPPPARRGPADPGALLAGAAPAARPLPGDDRPRQARRRHGHRDRPRTRRLRLGRDDQLNDLPQPVACRDARRRRNEPRAHYDRDRDPRT